MTEQLNELPDTTFAVHMGLASADRITLHWGTCENHPMQQKHDAQVADVQQFTKKGSKCPARLCWEFEIKNGDSLSKHNWGSDYPFW